MEEITQNGSPPNVQTDSASESFVSTEPQQAPAPKRMIKQMYTVVKNSAPNTTGNPGNSTGAFFVNFVAIDKIDVSDAQMRTHFEPDEIASLAESIKKHGVLQPIILIQNQDRYQVIAGERRLRASRAAGLDRIPARIIQTPHPVTFEIALRENLDRVDLHPIEEGEGYKALIEAKTFESHDAIAKAFGKQKSRITECIGFTRLPETTKSLLFEQKLGHRALLRRLLTTPVEQHAELISTAAKQTSVDEKKKKEIQIKPADQFKFKAHPKRVRVSGYTWKVGEGLERLKDLQAQLKELQAEVDLIVLKLERKN